MDMSSSKSPPEGSAEDEVASLDRLLTRLALTDDSKLEKVLSKLLPLAISRLASPYEAARKKVMEMLSHINKRVRSTPQLDLPLSDLLAIYHSPASSSSPLMLSFALVYAEMAFHRVSAEQQAATVPSLLQGLASRPAAHRDILLRCAVEGLECYGSERGVGHDHAAVAAPYTLFKEDAASLALWLEFCRLYLLLPSQLSIPAPPPLTVAAGTTAASPATSSLVVPGLSAQQLARMLGGSSSSSTSPAAPSASASPAAVLTYREIMPMEQLAKRKLGILNLNAALGLPAAQLYLHWLIAGGDSHERVSRRGEELLKRHGGAVDLDDRAVVLPLMQLYQGTVVPASKPQAAPSPSPSPSSSPLDSSSATPPASPPMKLRLLSVFVKSMAAANCFPYTLHVMFDAIYGPTATTRSKQQGMEFAVWVFKHAQEAQLRPMGALILVSLLKLLDQWEGGGEEAMDQSSRQLHAFTYQAIAQLATRCPAMVNAKSSVAERAFAALSSCSSAALRTVLQDALLALVQPYKSAPSSVVSELEALLLKHASSPVEAVRYCVLQWAIALLPPSHAPACYMAIMALADSKAEVRDAAQRFLFPHEPSSYAPRPFSSPLVSSSPSPLSSSSEPSSALHPSSSSLPTLSSLLSFFLLRHPSLASEVPPQGELSLLLPLKAFLGAQRCLLRAWEEEEEEKEPTARHDGGHSVERMQVESEEGVQDVGVDVDKNVNVEERVCVLLEHGMAREGTWELHASTAAVLLKMAAASNKLCRRFASRLSWLQLHVAHAEPSVRDAFARLLALSASQLPASEADSTASQLLDKIKDKGKAVREDEYQGVIAALGYLLALQPSLPSRSPAVHHLASIVLSAAHAPTTTPLPSAPHAGEPAATDAAHKGSGSGSVRYSTATVGVAVQALGHIGLSGPLFGPHTGTLPGSDESSSVGSKCTEASIEQKEEEQMQQQQQQQQEEEEKKGKEKEKEVVVSAGAVVRQLSALLTHRDDKLVQRAALAMGHMSFGEAGAVAEASWEGLLTLARSKNEAILFAAGEAVAFLWGWLDSPPFSLHAFLAGPHTSLSQLFSHHPSHSSKGPEQAAPAPAPAAPAAAAAAAAAQVPPPGSAVSPQAGKGDDALGLASDGGEGGEAGAAGVGRGAGIRGDTGQEGKQGRSLGETGEERVRRQEKMQRVLVDELLEGGKAEERCAAAVWLMTLLSFSGSDPHLRSLLAKLQAAFGLVLGDSNDLTQSMASRALSRIYSLGDEGTREELVTALVQSVMGGAGKRAGKLLEDTQLVTGTSAGSSGSGSGSAAVTTYRELCSVATDMGQPDLIYRFMDIANYQASLNSSRGAAFSFASVAVDASAAIAPHLPSLLPRLLRLMYDPSRPLAEAAAGIWRAVVPDPKPVVDAHLPAILSDLQLQVTGRLWRGREAACLALADLLPHRKFEEVSPFLAPLWQSALRAADDIKESVRAAADKLLRSLASLSLRLTDVTLSSPAHAQATCSIVMPVLLANGMPSDVAAVRHIALSTTAKMAKVAGTSLRPLLPQLVPAMLEALSGLEDQTFNYAEMHAERVGISKDKLDAARLSLSRDTPMWQTLDACLQQVNAESLPLLLPTLKSLTRSSVGINTRVGVARFISQLVHRLGSPPLRPHAPSLLSLLTHSLFADHTASGRKAWAAAAADVARVDPSSLLPSCLSSTSRRYLAETCAAQPEDRLACLLLLREAVRGHGSTTAVSEAVEATMDELLPAVFLARFDESPPVQQVAEECWDDLPGATSSSLRLHCSELIAALSTAALSSSWTRRTQAAAAMAAASQSMGADGPHHAVLQFAADIVSQLPGRLWEGKEKLIPALATVCSSCPPAFLSLTSLPPPKSSAQPTSLPSPPAPAPASVPPAVCEVVAAVVAAAGREKAVFRQAALLCLQELLSTFPTAPLFPLVSPPLLQVLLKHVDASSSSAPSAPSSSSSSASAKQPPGESASKPPSSQAILDAALTCLARLLPLASPSDLSSPSLSPSLSSILTASLKPNLPWTTRSISLTVATAYFTAVLQVKDKTEVHLHVTPLIISLLPHITDCLTDSSHSQLRSAAVSALAAAVSALQQHQAPLPSPPTPSPHILPLCSSLEKALEREPSPAIRQALGELLVRVRATQAEARS